MIFLKRQKDIIKPKKPYKYFKFYTRQLRDIAFLKKIFRRTDGLFTTLLYI